MYLANGAKTRNRRGPTLKAAAAVSAYPSAGRLLRRARICEHSTWREKQKSIKNKRRPAREDDIINIGDEHVAVGPVETAKSCDSRHNTRHGPRLYIFHRRTPQLIYYQNLTCHLFPYTLNVRNKIRATPNQQTSLVCTDHKTDLNFWHVQ